MLILSINHLRKIKILNANKTPKKITEMKTEQLRQLLIKHHIGGMEHEDMSGNTYLEWVVGFEDMFDFINEVYQCGYNEAIKQ
jgi:ribulose bisphosphate carboxylase small subunit